MKTKSPALKEYLEEVAIHLPRRERQDMLLEMESHILDRAEEEAKGPPDEETIRAVLATFGPPGEVAAAYGGDRFLIGPAHIRAFVAYTGILYAAHLVMILIGVAIGARIHLFPSRIESEGSTSWFQLLGVALHTLLFDIGLMVVIFALAARSRAAFRTPSIVFRVRRSPRAAIGRAVLAVLVVLCLTALRDRIFVVREEGLAHPISTAALLNRLPWIAVFLGLAVLKEVLYALKGETRATLALDAAVGAAGVALMVALVAGPDLLAFPESLKSLATLQPGLNDLVRRVTQLILVALAVAMAVGSVKRIVRLRQIWA